MTREHAESQIVRPWEHLYKDVLFEADIHKMPRRIEMAKHAILDRLEDVTCAKKNQTFEMGELVALRRAHRTLRALEQLYIPESARRKVA
ncbi:MAG TPA: hypothetical protein VH350_17550 [Candidatus Sulfotelmatobacter sp.]|nr:hypothetical protein [Candidatus Sulfotelmatobacter sp.]